MKKNVPQRATAAPVPRRRFLSFDRHGDVVDNLEDDCGATVAPVDQFLAIRLLARAEVRR